MLWDYKRPAPRRPWNVASFLLLECLLQEGADWGRTHELFKLCISYRLQGSEQVGGHLEAGEISDGVQPAWTTAERRLQAGGGRAGEHFPLCQGGPGPARNEAATAGLPNSPSAQERKDTEQRQEFRQLILYLKNNKQPDFTYWKREQGKRG